MRKVPGAAKKGHAEAWPVKGGERRSGLSFSDPITELDVLPDLPALVTMLLRLVGSIVNLAEGMLGAADGFGDQVYRFCHTFVLSYRREQDEDLLHLFD